MHIEIRIFNFNIIETLLLKCFLILTNFRKNNKPQSVEAIKSFKWAVLSIMCHAWQLCHNDIHVCKKKPNLSDKTLQMSILMYVVTNYELNTEKENQFFCIAVTGVGFVYQQLG